MAWRNIIAACSAITVFGFAFGMTYPMLSLMLESRGVSANMIGINSAMMPVGILLFSAVIPRAARRYGARQVAIIAAITSAILILCYKQFDSLGAWFIIRLFHGMSLSTLFVLSEAWIVGFADNHHRGKVVAIYSAVLSASFGAGPALVSLIGIEGWMPFLIGAGVIMVGIIPLSLIQETSLQDKQKNDTSSVLSFMPKAPVLLICVLAFAIFDAATLSLLPVYGLQFDLGLATSANLLAALIIGNTVLQFPIGWLADKYSHRLVLLGCAAVSGVLLILLPYVMATHWMWPVIVFAGAAGYGVYTVSLASLGTRFEGNELISGSAAFAVMWGVGALIGSVSSGWSMTLFGPNGLPVHLALVYFTIAIMLGIRGLQARLL